MKKIWYLRIAIYGAVVALFISFSCLRPVAASGPQKNRATSQYVYLFDYSGNYVKIDMTSQQVIARKKIWDDDSAQIIRPISGKLPDGCLVPFVYHDSDTGMIYALTSKEGWKINGIKYQIVTFKLPQFELVNHLELDTFDRYPTTVFNPIRKELFLSYYADPTKSEGKEIDHLILERYRVETLTTPQKTIGPITALKRIKRREETPLVNNDDDPNPLGITFSDRAYWSQNHQIIDEERILDEDGNLIEEIDPYLLLKEQNIQERFKPIERTAWDGSKYLTAMLAHSAGGRLLFAVNDDLGQGTQKTKAGSGLLVYDTVSKQALQAIILPHDIAAYDPTSIHTPSVHLTPDGNLIAVEHYERYETHYNISKTGEIDVYDVATGTLKNTLRLNLPPLSVGRVIGFSPDSKTLYFGTKNALYIAHLDGKQIGVIKGIGGFDFNHLIFSNK